MYFLIPYQKLRLETALPPVQVMARLAENTQPDAQPFALFTPHRFFSGEIKEHSFKLRRIIPYYNAARPVIEGHVCSTSTHRTTLELILRISKPVFIGGIIGFLALLSVTLPAVLSDTARLNDVSLAMSLLPVVYILLLADFNLDAHRVLRFFKQTLETRIVSNPIHQ